MSNKRALTVGIMTAGLSVGVIASVISPAAAQGHPVGGEGNAFFLSGAGNNKGAAEHIVEFGNAGDEVYFGDWDGDELDSPMVRRGNVFYVADEEGTPVSRFVYGDAGDTIVIGDWDGDVVDSIAVQRGNHFFVKNDNETTGIADSEFHYGDAGDTILVGNWDAKTSAVAGIDKNKDGDYIDAEDTYPEAATAGPGDTIMIQRGNQFFVKNDTKTGIADYTFHYGDAGDEILVGNWATAPKYGDDPDTVKVENTVLKADGENAEGGDELAVRRGNVFFQSSDLEEARANKENPKTTTSFAYGNPDDVAFVASWTYEYTDMSGASDTLYGDGLGVRRADVWG